MLTVSKDENGCFDCIQTAIDALPETGGEILIRPGIYREKIIVHRDHVLLKGENPEQTVIAWNSCAKDRYPDGREKGTFLSSTMMTTGRDVTVENLTIINDAGDGAKVGQAVAVYAAGDRGIWRNCALIAHQDTLFCGPIRLPNVKEDIGERAGGAEQVQRVEDGPMTGGRQYFENCLIRGDVDFIFGPYRCWFEGCTLFMNERGGWYTAANTNENQPDGFVFHNCRLTGNCRSGAGFLGRPWRKFARTVFLECNMDEHVAPEGFADWDEERVITERCGEWRTTGERADQQFRHPAQKRITDQEAAKITLFRVLGGEDAWLPAGDKEDGRLPDA